MLLISFNHGLKRGVDIFVVDSESLNLHLNLKGPFTGSASVPVAIKCMLEQSIVFFTTPLDWVKPRFNSVTFMTRIVRDQRLDTFTWLTIHYSLPYIGKRLESTHVELSLDYCVMQIKYYRTQTNMYKPRVVICQ